MSSSSVTLFYGLWVKTWSLVFAAEAYAAVHSTLLAIDLICLRHGKGQLIAEARGSKKTAADLPSEVWEMVKQQVIGQALWDAEQAALDAHRCPRCRRELGEELILEDETAADYATAWLQPYVGKCAQWSEQTCEWCLEYYPELWPTTASSRRSKVSRLLGLFSLRLASNEVYADASEDPWHDLLAICLPLRDDQDGRSYPRIYVQSCWDGLIETSDGLAQDLSPEALILPSDANLRFRRLVTIYNLCLDDPTGGNAIISDLDVGAGDGETMEEDASGKQTDDSLDFNVRQPRWMLWAYSDSTY